MEEENKNIDNIFRNKLENYCPDAPADVWGNINALLPVNKSNSYAIWWKVAAAVLVFVMTGYFMLSKLNNDRNENKAINNKNELIINEPVAIAHNSNKNEKNIKEKHVQKTLIASENSKKEIITINDVEEDIYQINKVEVIDDKPFETLNKKQFLASNNIDNDNYSSDILLYNHKEVIAATVEEKPEKKKTKLFSKLYIGAQVSPTYSYRNTGKNNVGMNEQPLMATSGGIYLENAFNDRVSVRTGIYYSVFGNQNSNLWMRSIFPSSSYSFDENDWAMNSVAEPENISYMLVDNSIGVIDFDSQASAGEVQTGNNDINNKRVTFEYMSAISAGNDSYNNYNSDVDTKINGTLIQKFKTIDIPLSLRYNIIKKKISVNVNTAINANLLFGNKVLFKSGNDLSDIGETQNIRFFNLSGSFGIGFEYPVKNRLILCLEPTLKYYLNSINREDNNKIYPYSYGIYSGFKYSF